MEKISQLTNKECIHCETEKETTNTALGIIAAFILILVACILSLLLFTPYTILISCNNGMIYQRHGSYPMTEVKKLEKILNTGYNNIHCNIDMFAR